MIIDTSYFTNKSVFIPNAVQQPSIGSNTPDALSQLKQEIDEKEARLLIQSLGYDQYSELKDQFELNGDWKPGALQKWKDLVDGVTYDGKRWNGLRYTYGSKKISLIAFYVFFYYLGEDFSNYSTTGIQVAEAENSITQLPNQKQQTAWNTFVKMYSGVNDCRATPNFFNNWNGRGMTWIGSNDKNEISMYEYLSAHNELYDISFFKRESIINGWNL